MASIWDYLGVLINPDIIDKFKFKVNVKVEVKVKIKVKI